MDRHRDQPARQPGKVAQETGAVLGCQHADDQNERTRHALLEIGERRSDGAAAVGIVTTVEPQLAAGGRQSWQLAGKGMRAPYMPPGQEENPNIQDVHRLAQCAAKPQVMWAQHHGGIYRSADAGSTWSAINQSFGFAVAAHPRDAQTAWFVPAIKDELRYPAEGKLAVTRTRDGGRSFDTLREGLPQEHAYDLIYRHGLDIDESGEQLAIGSTTGGLWLSANGGDSWRCLAAHLPPIYCLRFEN
jgi:hypothetical protein